MSGSEATAKRTWKSSGRSGLRRRSSPSRLGWRSKDILDSVLNVFARRRGRSDRDLSFDRGPCHESLRDFRGLPTQDLLVELRQLAPEDDGRVSPCPRERLERFGDLD